MYGSAQQQKSVDDERRNGDGLSDAAGGNFIKMGVAAFGVDPMDFANYFNASATAAANCNRNPQNTRSSASLDR
jgi:hypothetical protein